ncbi:transposase [Rudaea cellulosilytica]|uniref:transposase n=1 Tax=Rudaea cellulosilytica TaxID=540746 RepID=UPI000687C213
MPRRPRLVIAGIPLHITQRGVNRAATFIDDEDCELYRELLAESAANYAISVHAYALMSNHVHLLVTPIRAGDLAAAMRLLNQRYVLAFNRRHHRTGTLWESRFRSCLVDTERYLLTVYRYIDLNPVRAAMVDAPERYIWSSARTNLGLASDPCVIPHPVYTALGTDENARIEAYGKWLRSGVADEDLAAIRTHLQQERALGSPRFQAMVAKTLNRPVAVRPRGRPRKVLGIIAQPMTREPNSNG